MTHVATLLALVKADVVERARRTSFLLTLCLALYLGYAVNSGQILISLGGYRGIFNSAWVGGLMALVVTFFLGLIGFFLVKDTITRDEQTGVGQILATTSITRPGYLLAKWLSNLAVLSTLVAILALAALLIQIIHGEETTLRLWPLLAPFLLIAMPMMALVAALAVAFETVRWLKGGFGNLAYFGLFAALLFAGVLPGHAPWMDTVGISLVGSSMKAAAAAAHPDYDGTFTLSMAGANPSDTFVWPGMTWTPTLIAQRLVWLGIAMGIVLLSALWFDRFDPHRRPSRRPREGHAVPSRASSHATAGAHDTGSDASLREARLASSPDAPALTPLASRDRSSAALARLTRLELLLLVKGARWYWIAGMVGLWAACALAPTSSLRQLALTLAVLWPILIWSRMGEREARFGTEPLLRGVPHPLLRLPAASWLAGVAGTAVVISGALLGRRLHGEHLAVVPWALTVLFIPTLALALGTWSRTGKAFEVVYAILWYLGPFNPQGQLAVLDFLGVHPGSSVIVSPLPFAGVVALMLFLTLLVRRIRLSTST